MHPHLSHLPYLVASVCFILTLQALSSPKYARRGNLLGAAGMAIAIVGTLLLPEIKTFTWIIPAFIAGSIIGASMATWIPMTKMPERIALSHSFGGLAAALVGVSEYYHKQIHGAAFGLHMDRITMTAVGFEVFFGFLTFTGSLMAFSKLQGPSLFDRFVRNPAAPWTPFFRILQKGISGAPVTYKGQNASNIALFFGSFAILVLLVIDPSQPALLLAMCVIGLAVGVLAVLPIGGADMPVVISLLNSYAGLAAASTGFALGNNVLIIAGALDGTSGFLLSLKMSKAMNRSFRNVLFGAFGTSGEGSAAPPLSNVSYNQASREEAVDVLAAAQSVIFVPGYGMAVSQAQHAVHDLASALEARGASVKFAIHPVAGRMPGHMNVLLAEANIPYDQLFDIDDINDDFARTDVAVVVGANDVVNPAAKTNRGSPIFGMPVFNVDQARSVMCLKRSFNPGFSGIENDLFTRPNTMMVLGDAKKTLTSMISELKKA